MNLDDGQETIYFVNNPKEEKDIIEKFFNLLIIADYRIISYYGSYFDVPFIVSRALTLGVDVKKYRKIFPFRQIDVYDVVKRNLKLSKNSLGDVCKFLGIEKRFDIQGMDMPNFYLKAISGDTEIRKKIDEHLREDLATLRDVWLKIMPVIDLSRWEKE